MGRYTGLLDPIRYDKQLQDIKILQVCKVYIDISKRYYSQLKIVVRSLIHSQKKNVGGCSRSFPDPS